MQTTIVTKGFRPGETLSKFLSDQLQSLENLNESLKSAALKLSFTDNYFHCDLTVNISGEPFSISLCDKSIYEVVLNTIDFAENVLKNRPIKFSAVNRKSQVRHHALPIRTIFRFSAN